MLTSFWNWYVIIITIGTVIGCFWILQWTKGISNRDEKGGTGTTGHVWDEDLVELNNPLPRWWLQLFYGTIAFSLIYMVLFGGLGNHPGLFNIFGLKQRDGDPDLFVRQARQNPGGQP